MKLITVLGLIGVFYAVMSKADVILDWNELMLDNIRIESTGPTSSTRNLAILHTAIYDAINSVTDTHQPYRFQIPTTNCSVEAAAVGAAYEVVRTLYPSTDFWADDIFYAWLDSVPQDAALTNGLELGRFIGFLALDGRSDDGSSLDVPYIPSNLAGQWQRTPPFFRPPLTPQWRFVETFCLPDLEDFVPPPPPALDSTEYAVALNEVKSLGGKDSVTRTAEQSQIAVFWSDFSYTAMPPGHWHEIMTAISQSRTNTLEQNARLFALVSLAQADAAIVCWETKFRYNLWRPITAIHRADEDGNPATEKDAGWNHFLASPPFPAYTSGHSTFSKASAQVITHFYGTDAITFTAGSDSLPGVFRTFDSLAACADEIGMSRIYGGIHFQFDNVAGKECGRKIGDYVSANYLLPNDSLPVVLLDGFKNGPELRIHARVGSTCILEASTNLQDWLPISTNTAMSGGVLVRDTENAAAARFFRVRQD